MNQARLLRVVVFMVLATVLFSASGCSGSLSPGGSAQQAPGVTGPKPSVESVNAATSGMGDNYYAILDITVKNDGADGTVMVVGTVTQGSQTTQNSFPVNIAKNSTQVVRLVFKLNWEGGDWTPKVDVRIPAGSAVTTTVTTAPSITLSPSSGPVGTYITVTGAGFAASQTYTVSMGGYLGTTGSTLTGSFTAAFSVPGGLPANTYPVQLTTTGPGATQTATAYFQVTTTLTTLTITTTSLANGNVGVAYSQTLSASAGSGTYTWSLVAGSLPAGLSLNALTGAITGIPTLAGTFSFTAQVSDGIGTATQPLSISITAAMPLTITLPNGGESWVRDNTYVITWTTGGITGNVRILLSLNAGASWSSIIIGSTPNNGSYAWTVGGLPTTQARIRVESTYIPGIFDTSDANFTIQ